MLRKYKTFLFIMTLLSVLSLPLISASTLPLYGIIITIDPGHGGRDSGTYYHNIYEKNINLEISKKLEYELGKKGAIVYMTRKRDIDLSSIYDSKKKRGDLYRRLLKIKEVNSNLYLSIHINWYKDSTLQGAEVLYHTINKENKVLASSIMKELKKNTKTDRNISETDLYMYRNTTIPGVLIECGYLSNPVERKLLQDEKYQRKLAQSITKGVINFLKARNKLQLVV